MSNDVGIGFNDRADGNHPIITEYECNLTLTLLGRVCGACGKGENSNSSPWLEENEITVTE